MSTQFDIKTNEGLAAACRHIEESMTDSRKEWTKQLEDFLSWVKHADLNARSTLEFQQRLWDENPVSGVGQGQIAIDEVISKPDFRTWLAERSLTALPPDRPGRTAALEDFYRNIVSRFEAVVPRIPHLKIFRVLAAFFPDDFTCIAHRGALERVVRRLRGKAGETPVALHAYVRDRLDEVLGPAGDELDAKARRMEMAWYLYELTNQSAPDEEPVATGTSTPGEEKLLPLPAARRRRGLTALAGGFSAALGILEEVKEGLTRDEFLDYLRSLHPNLKEVSRRMIINILRSELGLIKNVNNEYHLTERGKAVLETSQASELGDWLLTRVLGVDHVLKRLQDKPETKSELIGLLQRVNPGWTSDFAPMSMLGWLVSMEAISRAPDGRYRLAPTGEEWTDRIHWQPEFLELKELETEKVAEENAEVVAPSALTLPPLRSIVASVTKLGTFAPELVEQLHLGLWSPRRRHFAVLAGISGSGKSLLGRAYAEALGTLEGDGPRRYMIQAVQPGWYDPTPLLGYMNPLQKDTYERTAFLSFLLKASVDSNRPYVVILDEMNLSHPEQYFAPLLSAMESGDDIRLHAEGDVFDGVPETIPYPANLAIIGTINMDETTHGLSDKVLDRAFTLEFWDIDLDQYSRWERQNLSATQVMKLKNVLSGLMKALAPCRLHFGWRVVDDILDFLSSGASMAASTNFDILLDAVIYAKVLPKIRGEDSERLRKALEGARASLESYGLVRSAERVVELRAELSRTGSTRFWR